MSATTMVTEREAVMREREAFVTGIVRAQMKRPADDFRLLANMNDAAAIAYPLPKVTRPRVVADTNGRQFRVFEGQMQTRHDGEKYGQWLCMESGDGLVTGSGRGLYVNAARVRLLADLLANPTETVEVSA